MRLPTEISVYLKKQKLKRIIPCAVIEAVILLILILWGKIIVPTDVVPFRISIYFLALILPFALTGVPLKLPKPWSGEILNVHIRDGVGFSTDADMNRPHGTLTFELTIQRSDGKTIVKEIPAGTYMVMWSERVANTNPDHFVNRYQAGDRVLQLSPTSPVIALPKEDSTHCQCAVCGRLNVIEDDCCDECRHVLVKKV